jgi:hypothetical protein
MVARLSNKRPMVNARKPVTRAERLADHFMKCAGVAAVSVDDAGTIRVVDPVGIARPEGCVVLCCTRGNHVKVAALAFSRAQLKDGQAVALAAVRSAAADLGISLTPHEAVVQRACAAVAAVSETIAKMQQTGGMKDLNRDFKAARKVNPALRYHDYLHDRKAAMLEAMARG